MTSLDDIMRMMPEMSWETALRIRAAIEEYKAGAGAHGDVPTSNQSVPATLDLAEVERRFRDVWFEAGWETHDVNGALHLVKRAIFSSGVRDVSAAEVDMSKVMHRMHTLGWPSHENDKGVMEHDIREALKYAGVRVTGGAS